MARRHGSGIPALRAPVLAHCWPCSFGRCQIRGASIKLLRGLLERQARVPGRESTSRILLEPDKKMNALQSKAKSAVPSAGTLLDLLTWPTRTPHVAMTELVERPAGGGELAREQSSSQGAGSRSIHGRVTRFCTIRPKSPRRRVGPKHSPAKSRVSRW